jgi:2'-5' RNA ligase
MRIFVAVEIDDAVRAAAEQTIGQLQRNLEGALRARWVAIANMHLTVRFIGHVADDHVPPLLDALRPEVPVSAFDLTIGQCGVFPSSGPPRVVWIAVDEGLTSLRMLHEELNRRLLPLGFEPEDRPYSAHLTLARAQETKRGSNATIRSAIAAMRAPAARCHVTHVTVFESRLSPKGATYHTLLRVPLRP